MAITKDNGRANCQMGMENFYQRKVNIFKDNL